MLTQPLPDELCVDKTIPLAAEDHVTWLKTGNGQLEDLRLGLLS